MVTEAVFVDYVKNKVFKIPMTQMSFNTPCLTV